MELVSESGEDTIPDQSVCLGNDVFIVHGHDEEAKQSVARFIERLGINAVILHEKPNVGRTIIQKFEDYSNVGFAVILLTPDDIGFPKDKPQEKKPRARQNVVFELGFFVGKLGRERVCALYKGNVEIPSDFEGVLYIPMGSDGGWRLELAREFKAAGIEVDLNKVI
jgi:predicted nucleotide-binding protein